MVKIVTRKSNVYSMGNFRGEKKKCVTQRIKMEITEKGCKYKYMFVYMYTSKVFETYEKKTHASHANLYLIQTILFYFFQKKKKKSFLIPFIASVATE